MQELAASCKNKIQLAENILQSHPKLMKTPHKGHGPGKDSIHIGTSIPIDVDKRLRRLATASKLTRSGYARQALEDAVARELTLSVVKRTTDTPDIVGKPVFPSPHARTASDLDTNLTPEPLERVAEHPATPYVAPCSGSRRAQSSDL
jgi:hypothetical protein